MRSHERGALAAVNAAAAALVNQGPGGGPASVHALLSRAAIPGSSAQQQGAGAVGPGPTAPLAAAPGLGLAGAAAALPRAPAAADGACGQAAAPELMGHDTGLGTYGTQPGMGDKAADVRSCEQMVGNLVWGLKYKSHPMALTIKTKLCKQRPQALYCLLRFPASRLGTILSQP